MPSRITVLLFTVLLCGLPASLGANARYDPSLRFRVLTTLHFVIYYHQGEEKLAERLATIVEQVHATLTEQLRTRPRGRTHVILVDQTDQANGWATPTPYNTIELTAVWPAGSEAIGNTDDWLAMGFAHEYTHILHLDRSEGWAGVLRGLFGRLPLAFPNSYLPQWQIEGLAVYEESRVTGRGRVPAGDFRMLVDEAARARRLEPLDRVNGGLVAWPSGTAAYVYGAYFHQYLADRFGDAPLGELAKRTAGRLPYTGSKVFTVVFGKSLGDLWRDYTRQRLISTRDAGVRDSQPLRLPPNPESPVPNPGDAAEPVRLTSHGFVVTGPRFLRPRNPSERIRVVYSVRNPHRFPSLLTIALDGSSPAKIASRVGGEGVTVTDRKIYFDQLELSKTVALHGDLYEFERATGKVRRLTHRARLLEADVSPTRNTLACILVQPGRRDLALFDLTDLKTEALLSEPETQFSSPRWSPDGRFIAVARQPLHGPSEIVVVDVESRNVHVLTSTRARDVTPVWTPDGRTIVFASDRAGPFNLYAVDVDSGPPSSSSARRQLWQITRALGGATSPDIAPDGRTIVYVGYTTAGFDLFTIALDRSTWRPVDDSSISTEPPLSQRAIARLDSTSGPALTPLRYTPFNTLLPRYWQPVAEIVDGRVRAGAATGGADVLGRHAYGAAAAWPVGSDAAGTGDRRPDWGLVYVYDRWQPTFFTTASNEISNVADPAELDVSTRHRIPREKRNLAAGMVVPFRRIRFSHSWLSAFSYERNQFGRASGLEAQERPALRLGWTFNNAREYGYSISREDGLTALVTSEHVRRGLGAAAKADAVAAEVRGFIPFGLSHAVLAVRAGAAVASGDGRVRRLFELGGSGPNGASLSFGSEPLSLLRGFQRGAFSGRHVALVNLDYRFPLVRPERGYGTLPVFLRTLHASLFFDAGHAWDRRASVRDLKTSAGLELSWDIVAGYFNPLTVTSGLAWGHDGHTRFDRVATYVRIGRAF